MPKKRLFFLMGFAAVCLAGLVAIIAVCAAPEKRNVILITIETLRADHVSCYGYHRTTTPYIDSLARDGVLFKNAISPSSWTPPAMASMMTSLYPMSHGVTSGIIADGEAFEQEVLDDGFSTLAESLRQEGYTTFGAVSNVHLQGDLGFSQGFDYYYCRLLDDAATLNERVLSWKNVLKESDPFFLWVHYFDPHDPYFQRDPWFDEYASGRCRPAEGPYTEWMLPLQQNVDVFKKNTAALQCLIDGYDSEINYVDAHIQKLIHGLELDDPCLLIVTSDHGEEFLERGYLGHGQSVKQELVHVPLIVRMPGAGHRGKVVERFVSTLDIMPTVLGVLGIENPSGIAGSDLFGNGGLAQARESAVYSDVSKWYVIKAVLHDGFKYIYNYCRKQEELYDLEKDPYEKINLVPYRPELAGQLQQLLGEWVHSVPKAQKVEKKAAASQADLEKLRALGYITDVSEDRPRSCSTGVCHFDTAE